MRAGDMARNQSLGRIPPTVRSSTGRVTIAWITSAAATVTM